MADFYISSTEKTIVERSSKKHGKTYAVVFRVTDPETLETSQKWLSGYHTKTEAKEAYTKFVTEHCELVKEMAKLRAKKQAEEAELAQRQAIPLIKDLIKEYYSALPNQVKDATIYEKQLILNQFIVPRFGEMHIEDLTIQELYKWQDELWATKNERTGEYFSYKYLSKIRTFFSAFLTWVSTRYIGVQNLLVQVQKPKRRAPQKKMQFWTRAEFEQFITVVDDKRYHLMFSMLFFTGRRKGEIFALTPEDIDLNKKSIHFTKSLTRKTIDPNTTFAVTSTKTELQSATPLCDTLFNELKDYLGEAPFFFGGDTPIPASSFTRAFDNYCKKANVKRIRIHDLRHSFVSMCIHLGASIPVVADLIGDTIEQVTKTYAHLYQEDKQLIIDKIG